MYRFIELYAKKQQQQQQRDEMTKMRGETKPLTNKRESRAKTKKSKSQRLMFIVIMNITS